MLYYFMTNASALETYNPSAKKKKKKKWELLDYFSWVLGTTNGIISVFWKMSSSHATIPGKIHLGNTGIYKDPSGLLENIVVGILLKHVY